MHENTSRSHFMHYIVALLFCVCFANISTVTCGATGKLCIVNAQDTLYDKIDFYFECVCHGSTRRLLLKLDSEILIDDGRDLPSVSSHHCHFKVYEKDDSVTTTSIGCPMCWKDYITVECYYTGHIDRGSGKVNITGWSAEYPCPDTTLHELSTVSSTSSQDKEAQNDSLIAIASVRNGAADSASLSEKVVVIVVSASGVAVVVALVAAVVSIRRRRISRTVHQTRTGTVDQNTLSEGNPMLVSDPDSAATVCFYKHPFHDHTQVDESCNKVPDTGYTTHTASNYSTLGKLDPPDNS